MSTLTSAQVGGYMPKEALAQLSREVRNTHFQMGGAHSHFDTAHRQQFQRLAGERAGPVLANHSRVVHFALGADQTSMKTETEAASRYKAHSVNCRNELSQETKRNLRAHHFGLGSDKPNYVTHHKEVFIARAPQLNTRVDSKADRSAHFQLGSDLPVTLSVARSEFTPKTAERADQEKYLADLKKDLRLCHFQIGSEQQSFVSTARKDYAGTPGPRAGLEPAQKDDLRREHFVLGTSRPEMTSVAKEAYTEKKDGRVTLSPEQVKELHASHFVLGQSQGPNQATSHELHKGFAQAPVPFTQDRATLRKTSLVLGSDQSAWQSVYTSSHSPVLKRGEVVNNGAEKSRQSHFVLGSHAPVNVSTNHDDYQRSQSAKPNSLDPEDAKELRAHHFQLGADRSADFSTSYEKYGAAGGPAGYMDPLRRKDLQATHFQYGSQESSFETSHTRDYRQQAGHSAEQVRTAAKTNVNFGAKQPGAWKTTYTGTYNWIQPVPDHSYKFEIQQRLG